MSVEKTEIAFFDIDKTIIRINSSEALIRHAYHKGVMSTWGLIQAAYTGFQYRFAMRDTRKIIQKMGRWLNGISTDKFNRISDEIFKKDLIPNIRPDILKEINKLKQRGTEVVILSSAISSVCIPLGKHINADAVICTELEVNDGKYTGKPVGRFCFRDEKLIRLKEFCKRKGYLLKNAAYYADAIDDVPALQEVGYPVCVTPDKKLEKIAQDRHWRIVYW